VQPGAEAEDVGSGSASDYIDVTQYGEEAAPEPKKEENKEKENKEEKKDPKQEQPAPKATYTAPPKKDN